MLENLQRLAGNFYHRDTWQGIYRCLPFLSGSLLHCRERYYPNRTFLEVPAPVPTKRLGNLRCRDPYNSYSYCLRYDCYSYPAETNLGVVGSSDKNPQAYMPPGFR